MIRGRLITLEGLDGAGKSTQLAWLDQHLSARGIPHRLTREPGGTPLGEQLRGLLLHHAMHADTETLLMFAARREHVAQVIEPALAAGVWVVSDRFADASHAYQGGGRGLDPARVSQLEHWTLGELQPDLTLLFDVPLEVSQARLVQARTPDRFEQEQAAFHARVRSAYLERARQHPNRIRVLNADQAPDQIQREMADLLEQLCLRP